MAVVMPGKSASVPWQGTMRARIRYESSGLAMTPPIVFTHFYTFAAADSPFSGINSSFEDLAYMATEAA